MSGNYLNRNGFKGLLTCLLLLCAVICIAAVTDLNGKWTGSIKITDQGVHSITYTFKTNGDKLAGTLQAGHNTITITDGKITGNDFFFNLADKDGSSMWMPHKGKYHPQGDSVTIIVNFAGIDHPCTLKRAGN